MKKSQICILKKICLFAIFAVPHPAMALSLGLDQPACCIGNLNSGEGGCTYFTCSYGSSTRYFTNCSSCENSMHTLTMNGPYYPCGNNGKSLDSSYGECAMAIIGPVDPVTCAAGTYGSRGLCQACPEPGTSDTGAKAITDCYIPAGSGDTDNTGKWQYDNDCHYST